MNPQIRMVGFDADDTLWKSEDYYREAEAEFRRIVKIRLKNMDEYFQNRPSATPATP